MPLATNYTNVENLRVDFLFNQPTGLETFQPLTIRVQGTVVTTEGGRRELQTDTTVGSPTANPLTIKQIYTQTGSVTNLHTRVQNALKAFYTAAISEDISI